LHKVQIGTLDNRRNRNKSKFRRFNIDQGPKHKVGNNTVSGGMIGDEFNAVAGLFQFSSSMVSVMNASLLQAFPVPLKHIHFCVEDFFLLSDVPGGQ
jgi:hypothetical protein